MKILEITMCSECPFRSYSIVKGFLPDHCNKNGNKIINKNVIPLWCPLPDAGESK